MPQLPRYYVRVPNGKYSGGSDDGVFEVNDDAAAWQEMVKVCGDVVGDVCRGLKEDSDWHLELLDETRKPLFRISLVAESLT
jgi:hypothetical protein